MRGESMVKKLLTLFIVLLAITTPVAGLAVKVPEITGLVGEVATVPVEIEDAKNVGGIDIAILYDPAILKVKSVEKGVVIKGLLSSNTDREGIIVIGIVDANGMNGDGSIAEITFEVLKDGDTPIVVQAKAYEVDTHVDLQVETQNGKFIVVEKQKEDKTGFEGQKEEKTTVVEKQKEEKTPGFEASIVLLVIALVLLKRGSGE
jgi:ribosomal protein S28E/S33